MIIFINIIKINDEKSAHVYYNLDEEDLETVCNRHGLRVRKFKEYLKKYPETQSFFIDMPNLDPSWKKKSR